MFKLNNYQVLPFTDDEVFESFVKDLFNSIYKTQSFDFYGRKGQKQNGIDIYSAEKCVVIQCKNKLISRPNTDIKSELIKDLEIEFTQFLEFNKSQGNPYNKFIFASSFANDVNINNKCTSLQKEHNFNIEYWHWKRLIEKVENDIHEKYFKELVQDTYSSFFDDFFDEIHIDKNSSAIDQIFTLFNTLFDEIKVINCNYFLNHYPFKTDTAFSYRDNFTLYSESNIVIDFFKSFQINEKEEIQTQPHNLEEINKIEFILNTFVRNNIWHFESIAENIHVNFPIHIPKKVAYLNSFDKFNYLESLQNLPVNEDNLSLEELMELGYYNYQYGNPIKSIEVFQKAKEMALLKNQKVIHLICCHNLKHLGRHLKYRVLSFPEKQVMIDELSSLELNIIPVDKKDEYFKELLISRNFYSEPSFEIFSLTEKVVENYYAFLRGTVSSKNYEWDIMYEYSTLHSFLNQNHIIYDFYKEYKDTAHVFLNGVLAAYSIKSGGGRIINIGDFEITHLIEYGDAQTINNLFKRYEIDQIEYINNQLEYNFIDLFENFINNRYVDLELLYEDKTDMENEFTKRYIGEKRNVVFKNFLMFASIIKFSKSEDKKISGLIIRHIKNSKTINRFDIDFLFKFIIFKCKNLPIAHLKFYITHFINNQNNYFLSNNLWTLKNELMFHNIKISFSQKEFSKIKSNIFVRRQRVNFEYNIAVGLINIIEDGELKQYIVDILLEEFNKSRSFDLFYHCVIFDAIPYDHQNFLFDFIDNYKIVPIKEKRTDDFGDFITNSTLELDQLFNICLKCGINIKDKKFKKFKKISKYYEWLIDINSFDYKYFKIEWIDHYSTKYYFEYFRKSEKLRSELIKALKNNRNNRIKRSCNRIYNFTYI
jgi:hypothetical protein